MKVILAGVAVAVGIEGHAMADERIRISSDRGSVTATLRDNKTTQALLGMLPVTVEMGDHLRQEKTGSLPRRLPENPRQLDFAAGMIGMWNNNHFVVYYRSGRVPEPGIVVLGQVTGDVSLFERPGPVTVRVERAD